MEDPDPGHYHQHANWRELKYLDKTLLKYKSAEHNNHAVIPNYIAPSIPARKMAAREMAREMERETMRRVAARKAAAAEAAAAEAATEQAAATAAATAQREREREAAAAAEAAAHERESVLQLLHVGQLRERRSHAVARLDETQMALERAQHDQEEASAELDAIDKELERAEQGCAALQLIASPGADAAADGVPPPDRLAGSALTMDMLRQLEPWRRTCAGVRLPRPSPTSHAALS